MYIAASGILQLLRFVIGACLFSFFNIVIGRLPAGEGIVRGRSHCLSGQKEFAIVEWIPCLGYLLLRGNCRGCGKKIFQRQFWMELLGGLCFVGCGAYFGYGAWGLLSLRGILGFVYLGILTMVAFIDWDTKIICNRFHIGILFLGIAALRLFPSHSLGDRLFGLGIVSMPMLLLALFTKGAFGGGDIKLLAASGFFLGWRAVLSGMFWGLCLGGCYGSWMLFRGKLSLKDFFAFGPFLAVGLGAAFFWGDQAMELYLSLL